MESKVNDYQLRQGNQIYVFSTSIVNNLVRLACKNSYGKNFSRDFSYYEINSMDPIFNEINSEQDAIKFIDKALNKYRVGVREENGLIKVIFYVSNRGLLHPIEFSLGEGGKYIYNENETTSQTYGNTNYSYNGGNTFDQQPFYTSENIGIGNSITDSTFNNNYGYNGQNVESFGSFMLQDNNQYAQANYETTSSLNYGMRSLPAQILPTKLYSGNDYNTNSYQYSYNQYSTSSDNNFYSNSYNTYQTNETTSYDLNSLNNTNNYEDTNNQYNQQALESTAFTGETFQGNEHTAKVKQIISNSLTKTSSLKSIGTSNNNIKIESQYETHTTPLINSSLQLNNAQKESENKNQTYSANKNNTDQINSTAQKSTDERNISLNESEIQILKNKAAEADSLRAQLAQLIPLKQQFEQINILKSQLDELNSLREKAAELNSIKDQLKELNDLKQQVSQMNVLKKQLEEMETLKEKVEDTENLKKRIEILEKTNIEYEKEIKDLRASQFASPISHRSPMNKEKKVFETIDLTFKEKPEKIYVKGDIIHDAKELEMLTRKINKFNRKLTLNLLYKATADSDKAIAFHRKCNDAKSTIVLVETDKGKRFGGFTTCSWSGECIDKKDEEAFIFSLDKMKIYDNIPEEDAIGCYPKFGPIFLGCQIRIYDEAFKNGGTTFEKGLNFDTDEDYELTGGERIFNVKEIEVYEVIPQ